MKRQQALIQYAGIPVTAQVDQAGERVPGWLAALSAVVIALFAIRPLRRVFMETATAN